MGEETSPVEAYQTAYQVLAESREREDYISVNEENSKDSNLQSTTYENLETSKPGKVVMFTVCKRDEGEEDFDIPSKEDKIFSEVQLNEKIKPYLMKPKKIPRKRTYEGGKPAVGISVLAVQGWVGNLSNDPIHLRHDSCADVSLISLEYYKTLVNPPAIKKGTKMNLWQLTDKDSKIEGYVSMPIFTLSEQNELIETEVEAYLVPLMSMPILLGEDYQLNYELTVKRNIKVGATILYGDNPKYSVRAMAVDKTDDFGRLKASAKAIQKFMKAKNHRREKNRRKRKAHREQLPVCLVLATSDV